MTMDTNEQDPMAAHRERWRRDREARNAIAHAAARIHEAQGSIEAAARAVREAIRVNGEAGESACAGGIAAQLEAEGAIQALAAAALKAGCDLQRGIAAYASKVGRFSALDLDPNDPQAEEEVR